MPINLSSRGNPRPSFRYGSAIRNNIVMSQNVTRYSNNAIDELFAQNEQGLWLDLGDMNASKINWRRNLFTYTEQFDNSFWGKQVATVSANAAAGPFGGTTADLVYPSASGTFQGITLYYPSTRIRTVHTVSVYVKASGKNWMYFYNVNAVGGNGGVWYNLQTGVVGTVNAAYSNATMTSVGDGWYRCSASYTFSGGNDYFYILAGDASNSSSCTANGTDGILIWGAQLELGSTLTSYQTITDFSTEFKAAFPQHAIYQDSAGATPCTTAGEPVGLVIDKRLGGLNNLGPELLSNGNFDTDTVWTKGTGWTISGGVATYDGTGGTSAIYAPVNVSAGKTYLISLRVLTNTGSGANTIYLGDSNVVRSVNLPPNEYTMFTHTVTGGGNFWIYGRASETFVVDSISVKEVYGNPAYQTTSGSRPTLGRNPYNGRRNLITYSEELDNAAWTKQSGCTVIANSEVGPLGIANADTLVNGSSGSSGILWSFAGYQASTQYTLSFWVKAGTATTLSCGVYQNTGFLNSTATVLSGSASLFGTSIQGVSNLTSAWTRIQLTFTTGATGTPLVYFYPETSGVGTGLTNVLTQVQLESGANATQYQKVTSTYDVTEQGFADCWHLHFDGSDDFLITNSVSLASTDKVTAITGVRKLSDAAIGILAEHGNTVDTFFSAPRNATGADYGSDMRHLGLSSTTGVQTYAAPISNVITALFDRSAGTIAGQVQVRVDGILPTQNNTGTGPIASSNFTNNAIYIGRRANATLPFSGHLYQLIIRSSATSASKISQVEKFVASKTGLIIY